MYKTKLSLMTGMGLLILVAAMVLSGCSSKSVKDDVSGADVSFQVTASPPNIAWNESTVIEVVMTNGTDPVAGQMVTFTVEPQNAGYFTPKQVATDNSGIAAAVYNPYTSGSQLITVSAGFGDGVYSQAVGIEVTETYESAEGNVEISLSKSLLLADGADSTRVLITVRDAVGQRVPDSTLLICVAGEKFVDNDSNGFWSAGIDWLSYDANGNYTWDAIGSVPTYAVTANGNGTAQITYQSGNDAGTAYLKVTVADANIGGSGEVAIQLKADADINSIYLASDSINLSVKQTGGIETAQLRATGYDLNGNAVPEGLPITFIVTDGPGGGEHLSTGGYGPFTTFTNSQGVASMSLHSGTASGTIRIRAFSDTVLSNATQVMVSAGPPAHIVVAADECNVDYWDNVAAYNEVVAIISDVYLNPVNDSTVVYFWTDEGTMKSHEERTHDLEGIAGTKWFAGNNVATADGRVWIYAETAGGTVVDSSMFYNTHWPDTLICTGVPTSILADGNTKYYVWITGLDLNGNPVIGGTNVEADAIYLDASGGQLQNGCYSATDRVEIKSKVLDMDYSVSGGNDDGIGGYDYLTYWHPAGAVSVFQIALTTANAYAGTSDLQLQGSPGGGQTAYFTATIKDRFGNPLGDHTLNISTPVGSAVPASVNTNGYGEANFSWVVPVAPGDYTIVVQDVDPRGGLVLSTTIKVSE
ncbi:MAG: hypothetical protein ABIE70_06910 [bacterium]